MKTLTTTNPFSGATINNFELETLAAVQTKVKKAHQAQQKWNSIPVKERVTIVKQAIDYFDKNRKQIAQDISEQLGRPLSQCDGEINGFFERANYLCSIAEETLKSDIIESNEQFHREIQHVPLGVVFVISAWNYPLLVTVNSVIPALLSGNTVLLKHSSRTPSIGEHFQKALYSMVGLDSLLQSIVVDHTTTGAIIEQLDINHVVFTGSVAGGRQILQHTSKKFITPQLELGGKDGVYVDCDVDLKLAADSIVDGAMFNSGQSCCGVERVFVHTDVADDFIKLCSEAVSNFKLGDPTDSNTNLGPLAQASSADEMLEQIKTASEQGATIISGGHDLKISEGRFLEPTLLTNVLPEMEIMQEENFGPILPILKVENIDQAIDLINDSQYGLTSAIFTTDLKRAQSFAEQVDCGTVFMNRCDYLDPALPWTGVKNSGCGSSLSKYGFYGVTRRKSLNLRK